MMAGFRGFFGVLLGVLVLILGLLMASVVAGCSSVSEADGTAIARGVSLIEREHGAALDAFAATVNASQADATTRAGIATEIARSRREVGELARGVLRAIEALSRVDYEPLYRELREATTLGVSIVTGR